MSDEQTVASLFRLPPEQFTAARDRLVAELRQAGKPVVAAQIAKLARPTPVVWAINQLAHRDRATIEALLQASDALRRAQLGRASASVSTLARAYQGAVTKLVERGLAELKDAGRAATRATRHRLTATLMAASADSAISKSLRAGQLRREVAAGGFDVFEGARPALRVVRAPAGEREHQKASPSSTGRLNDARRDAGTRVRLETARADLARAESRVAELSRAEAEASRLAAEARERAAAARRAAAGARADVARARERLRTVEKGRPGPLTD